MATEQRVGLHVSAAGGVQNAPDNAKAVDAECFQFFSRSPRGGAAPVITDEQASVFKAKCREYGFTSYIHAPYYINFASKKKSLRVAVPRIIREELQRGTQLGVKYVVTHLGSAREYVGATTATTPPEALDATVQGLQAVFDHAEAEGLTTQLLLEIAAGAGSVVGDKFEELAYILEQLGRDDVHICLDTCHLFASGYDIRTLEAVETTMTQFRKQIGIRQLKLLHVNDSKGDLGGNKDRHEHLGRGKIGSKGLQAILVHKDFQHVDLILETHHDELLAEDIRFLKKYRTNK